MTTLALPRSFAPRLAAPHASLQFARTFSLFLRYFDSHPIAWSAGKDLPVCQDRLARGPSEIL